MKVQNVRLIFYYKNRKPRFDVIYEGDINKLYELGIDKDKMVDGKNFVISVEGQLITVRYCVKDYGEPIVYHLIPAKDDCANYKIQ